MIYPKNRLDVVTYKAGHNTKLENQEKQSSPTLIHKTVVTIAACITTL
jgi:hypothetical protein